MSESTVRRYLSKFWLTGDIQPVDYHHGPSTVLDNFEHMIILRLINENPGIYLHEMKAKLLDMFGTTVSTITIWRTLHEKMGYIIKCFNIILHFNKVIKHVHSLWEKFLLMIPPC